MNLYAKFYPDNNRTGCWSTAIAQILYFHRIMPVGKVDYEATAGYKISEDLDSYENQGAGGYGNQWYDFKNHSQMSWTI